MDKNKIELTSSPEFLDLKSLKFEIDGKAGTALATSSKEGLMSKEDKAKLDTLQNYSHPANHEATMITEDASHRFTTDAEKERWNNTIQVKGAIADINSDDSGVKIDPSKLKLEGAEVVGDNGEKIRFKKEYISMGIGDGETVIFGHKNLESNYQGPKLYMSAAEDLDSVNGSYFVMCPYEANENPQKIDQPYHDLAYHCKNETFTDWSNLKFYNDGDIRLSSIKDVHITTNYFKGAYNGTQEKKLAVFTTANEQKFNSHLQIGCIRNMDNIDGLILADDHVSGHIARVGLQVDNSNAKYFRPITGEGDIELGSGNFRWKRLFSKESPNVSSDIRLKEDIHYVDVNKETTGFRYDKGNISIEEMYDFVKDKLKLATYKYKGSESVKVGFIAQDLLNDKIGDHILETVNESNKGEEEYLGYDIMNYVNMLAGALKYAIKEIETLKASK